MGELVDMISNFGYGVIFVAYFLVKDWKQNSKMLELMTQFNTTLALINDKLGIE